MGWDGPPREKRGFLLPRSAAQGSLSPTTSGAAGGWVWRRRSRRSPRHSGAAAGRVRLPPGLGPFSHCPPWSPPPEVRLHPDPLTPKIGRDGV